MEVSTTQRSVAAHVTGCLPRRVHLCCLVITDIMSRLSVAELMAFLAKLLASVQVLGRM